MKKKMFFLILLVFLLCGCTANVNITIKDSTVSERITITEKPYDVFSIDDIKQQYRNYVPAFYNVEMVDTMPDEKVEGVEYYRMYGSQTDNTYTAFYQYDYNFREYKNATSLRNAFRSSEVQYDPYEKQILFTTEASGMTLFKNNPQLTEVKINITTFYPVIESNADYHNGNLYTWVFNKNTQKSVYLLLDDQDGKSIGKKDEKKEDKDNKEDNPGSEDDKKEQGNNGNGSYNPGNNNSKKDEDKSDIEKGYEKIQEKGKKHPYVVVLIALGGFLFIILCSFRIKKV